MSKPNIKFIYTGQFRSEVQQLQKGPAKLENLYGSIIHPEYMPITLEDQQPQVVSTVEVNSKPTSPNSNSLFRYKSAENIRVQEEPRSSNASNTLNIEEVGESEMVARKQANSKKPKIPQQPDQIVLNAPSYKFVPRKEGEIAVHSRKEYKKHTSVEKCLTSESTLRSRRQTNKNINNEPQLKSSNPFLKIESVDERDFKTEPSEQQQSSENNSVPPSFDERIVLKAPKYKYVPQPEGELAVNNRKKEYVKSQKTAEKYFYGGVQSRQESDFISCFGCIKPTGRTYQAQDD